MSTLINNQDWHDRQTKRIQRNIKHRARCRKYSPNLKLRAFIHDEYVRVTNRIKTEACHNCSTKYFEKLKKRLEGAKDD